MTPLISYNTFVSQESRRASLLITTRCVIMKNVGTGGGDMYAKMIPISMARRYLSLQLYVVMALSIPVFQVYFRSDTIRLEQIFVDILQIRWLHYTLRGVWVTQY